MCSRSRLRRAITGLAVTVLLGTGTLAAAAGTDPATRRAWNRPAEPFRVMGNLYYVGTEELASWLIRTDQGLVLLDGGLEESVPLIERNIRRLGFRVEDIRILLNSHAHFDHSGGLARLKLDSGAELVASEGDRLALETGRFIGSESEPTFAAPPVHVDRIIEDGATVQLGRTTLTAHLTPGHTRGCTTWTMPVMDAGHRLKVMFYCSTSVSGNRLGPDPQYPGIVEDYRRTFERLATLKADVFLANHQGLFDLWEKRAAMRRGGANPFVDPTELGAFVAASRAIFERELARQREGAAAPVP